MKDDGYHFCSECLYADTITTEEVKKDGHKMIIQHCAKMKYGQWWYKSDYGKIRDTCAGFIPSQIQMEGL